MHHALLRCKAAEEAAGQLGGAWFLLLLSVEGVFTASGYVAGHGDNDVKVDAVVSIHCNSAEVCPTRDEARVYYYRGSERGRELALRVIASFQERRLPVAPDPWGRGFYVLRYTRAPAVLVELGFICSALGAARLMSGRGQVDGVKALVGVNRSQLEDPSRVGSCSQKGGPGLPLQTSQAD